MFVIDDRFSVIGSFNLDERSIHIDTESVLIIDSPAFNKILSDFINENLVANSLQVGKNNEYLPSDSVPNHEVSTSKRFKYALCSMLGVVRCLI